MPTRRHLLATMGVAATGAGCMGALGDEGEPSPDGTTGPDTAAETVRLGELAVENNHEEAHEVQLAIESGGDVLHLGTYDLEADGGSTAVEGVWLEEAGDYRIHARLDENEVQTADVAETGGAETDCVRVLVRVGRGGRLDIWDGAGCEDS